MYKYNLTIVAPTKDAYSESFIRAHQERLAGNISFLYGGDFPSKIDDSESNLILPRTPFQRCFIKAQKLLNNGKVSDREQALINVFKRLKTDVVLAEYGPVGGKVLEACRASKIPLIVHFHGYDASRRDVLERYKNLYHRVFDYATQIVVVSQTMKKGLAAAGAPEEKLVLNPYGPDPSFLDVQPRFTEKALISIGRFVEKKAPHLTIFAFRKVLEIHPDAKLYMAGNGYLRKVCADICQHFGLQDHIKFIGVISREEYQQYLSKVYAMVQHSVVASDGDMEGTPVAILEAQAAGIPVVSTWHAGIPDVVHDNKTGYLVKESDVEAMSEAMVKLLSNKTLASSFGRMGRERVCNYFSMERHISKLDRIVQQAVPSKG